MPLSCGHDISLSASSRLGPARRMTDTNSVLHMPADHTAPLTIYHHRWDGERPIATKNWGFVDDEPKNW